MTRIVAVLGVCVVLLLALIGVLVWKIAADNPSDSSEQELVRIIGKTARHYELPTDEQPTVAEIKDKQKLANQTFFTNARNGDYLLVYEKARLALVYRESSDKLVNVGPINIKDNANEATK